MHNLGEKVILVSKRIISDDGSERYDTYFGKVKSFNDNTVIVTRDNGQEESLPYGDELYEKAEEGFYELDDGATHENPDFIAKFAVYENEQAYEKYGNNSN